MNRYHIDVIGSSNKTKHIIEADVISWSDAGLYEFSIVNTNDSQTKTQRVAYFPVGRSVIHKIEYNIEYND